MDAPQTSPDQAPVPWPRRVWAVLMTPVGERVSYRLPFSKQKRRGAPHGVALLTVLIGLALMSAVVTDLGSNEMVRYKLAIHDRDVMRAQALSESGVNIARLVLAVQAALQPMVTQLVETGFPLPAQTVWDLIPLESGLMRGMISGELQSAIGLDVSSALEKRKEEFEAKQEDAAFDAADVDPELEGTEPFVPPEGGFGGFQGEFNVEIDDEEKKAVSLRGWVTAADRFTIAQKLYSLFLPERYDFLFEERDADGNRTDRYELVANIYDWIDTNEDATDPRADQVNWGRLGSGSEDTMYTAYDGIEPKNEYFDSQAELRLVRGWTDAHDKAFGDAISIYGEAKTNILSAPPQSVESLVRICAKNPTDPLLFDPEWMRLTVQTWMSCKQLGALVPGGCQASPKGFVAYLGSGLGTQGTALLVDEPRCMDNISTESKNFTVKSTAQVGDVTRTVSLVVRVHGAIEERYHYSIVGR